MNNEIFDRIEDEWLTPPPDPLPVSECARCGEPIYEKDIEFGLSDGILCEDCLRWMGRDGRGTAKVC